MLRVEAMKRLKVDQFEFSQSYLQFYDKLEKANWFLETMIATAGEPTDGRLISFLLQDPIQDGGQWDMFADLVRKYGVVPKSVMPEAESSGESMPMNGVLRAKLREGAAELRRAKAGGATAAGLRRRKDALLETIYRMLAIHLGRPPQRFEWQWRDKDDEFHRDGEITPQQFYKRYVGFELSDYVSLINCPTDDKPFGKLYTVQHLGNVVGGTPVRYVNVDIATFKKAAVAQIAAGQPVWFGCDVGKSSEREQGAMERDMYDLELLYETSFSADKAERVEYGHSVMTHAMVPDRRRSRRPRQAAQVEGREQLGREGRRQGLLHDERPVVRRVHVRGRDRSPAPRQARAQGARHRAGRAAALGSDGLPRARVLSRQPQGGQDGGGAGALGERARPAASVYSVALPVEGGADRAGAALGAGLGVQTIVPPGLALARSTAIASWAACAAVTSIQGVGS